MRIGVGDVNPYLSDPQWLAAAKSNVAFAASQGCVFDYVHNIECCLGTEAGGPARARAILAQGPAAIADAVNNCSKYQTQTSFAAPGPEPSVTASEIHQLSPRAPQPLVPRITPQNLTRPLPDITQALRPVQRSCPAWNQLNGWISDHPVIATAFLVGTAVFLVRGKRGR
jgi:hypothetical protein